VVKWLFPITNKKHYDGEWKNTAPDTHNMDKLLFDVLEHSGISKQMLEKYKFDSYETPYQWQKDMKNKSLAFIAENLDTAGKWLYIGGQSGAGKTHICTAICQRLAKKYTVRYELWSRVGGLIKSRAMEQDEKDKLLYELAKPEVMYVDDLLKGTSKVTDGDIKALFDLINTRYLNNNSITIISSELSLEELKRIDEAIAGRIAERAQGYTLALPRNGKFNYRFKEAEK
jgi:DNA replication protein DnaC